MFVLIADHTFCVFRITQATKCTHRRMITPKRLLTCLSTHWRDTLRWCTITGVSPVPRPGDLFVHLILNPILKVERWSSSAWWSAVHLIQNFISSSFTIVFTQKFKRVVLQEIQKAKWIHRKDTFWTLEDQSNKWLGWFSADYREISRDCACGLLRIF